jgi:hypothetical protein
MILARGYIGEDKVALGISEEALQNLLLLDQPHLDTGNLGFLIDRGAQTPHQTPTF